ncbi:hypothetical protein B0H13DRAFT_1897396 [Mycena leptocephala]|nr:hypothetical protein B0H13DRAFT_1897396 [Mycena leptocephala]
MQIETITFGQAEIRSADDRRMICHSSADDLPLIRRRSATHPQRVCSSGADGCDLPDSTGHPQLLVETSQNLRWGPLRTTCFGCTFFCTERPGLCATPKLAFKVEHPAMLNLVIVCVPGDRNIDGSERSTRTMRTVAGNDSGRRFKPYVNDDFAAQAYEFPGEFPFNELLKYCSGEREPKVYEIGRKKAVTIRAKLEAPRLPNTKAETDRGVEDLSERVGAAKCPASGMPATSVLSTPAVDSGGGVTRPFGTEFGTAPMKTSLGSCRSQTTISDLSAALDTIQQVGRIGESDHLMEPIASILSELAGVHREVGETYDARNEILDKVAALARDISGWIFQLKRSGLADPIGSLKSDLDEYKR